MSRSLLALLLLPSVTLAAEPLLKPWCPITAEVTRAARIRGFLEAIPKGDLRPTDGVAAGVLVLAEKNKRYVVYAPNGGRVNLKIPAGDWRVQAYNPRTGVWGKKRDEKADDSGLTLKFQAGEDWAAVLVRD
jgi:hypothetical protein